MTGALGMIAGAGDLPVDLAGRCKQDGNPYVVLRLKGIAAPELGKHPGAEIALGRLGQALDVLQSAGCDQLIFVGKVIRPRWRDLSLDWTGVVGLLKVLGGWRHDDRLHRAISALFERRGIRVVGPADIWPDLLAPVGTLTARSPQDDHWNEIRMATSAALKVGLTDRGQGAVARNGQPVMFEDRDHTDGLLRRVANAEGNGGVLAKFAKPQQDRRLDLPVIGPETIAAAANAGLAGIVVEAGGAILARKAALIEAADKAGLFVVGIDPADMK